MSRCISVARWCGGIDVPIRMARTMPSDWHRRFRPAVHAPPARGRGRGHAAATHAAQLIMHTSDQVLQVPPWDSQSPLEWAW
mmetsp:Transcript_9781/g.33185  ORF Transcript_9781/g.33185 Transcript_9781/m.33185 type:complete len:82 (+) Transcript_9781:481-726(+)